MQHEKCLTDTASSSTFLLQTVASKNIWPQFEIVHEDECEAENSEHEGFDKSLVSTSRVDESVKSLLDTFEVSVLFLFVLYPTNEQSYLTSFTLPK